MGRFQNLFFICIYTSLFLLLIVIGKEIFFSDHISSEEKFLEISHKHSDYGVIDEEFYNLSNDDDILQERANILIYESFREKFLEQQAQKIRLRYVPSTLEDEVKNTYTPLIEVFIYKENIFRHITSLGVYLYQNTGEVRGRMKSGNIHLYGIQDMGDEEFISVFTHEFGHYFDIYSLVGKPDLSQKFYDISWKSSSVMQEGTKSIDFVSGYALTNQYEDFAESYVYYILHNNDFYQKSLHNISLGRKYNFIKENIFTEGEFQNTTFSYDNAEDYYWDITKIRLDTKKFLQYTQNNL